MMELYLFFHVTVELHVYQDQERIYLQALSSEQYLTTEPSSYHHIKSNTKHAKHNGLLE
jgi:hypothetical protein